jgi:hypothetical protein
VAAVVRVLGEEFPSEDSIGGGFSELGNLDLVEAVDCWSVLSLDFPMEDTECFFLFYSALGGGRMLIMF